VQSQGSDVKGNLAGDEVPLCCEYRFSVGQARSLPRREVLLAPLNGGLRACPTGLDDYPILSK